MPLNETQTEIQSAIESVSRFHGVASVEDIAEQTGLSKQTVRNHIGTVLEENPAIKEREIGQARVFYMAQNRVHELFVQREPTTAARLTTKGQAVYATLEEASEESEFDLIAHWFDSDLKELEDYVPQDEEIGEMAGGFGNVPVAIEWYRSSAMNDVDAEVE